MTGSRRKSALLVLVLWVLGGIVGPGVHAVLHAGDAPPHDAAPPQWVAEELHLAGDCALCDAVFHFSNPPLLSLSQAFGAPVALVLLPERMAPRAVRHTAHSRGPPLVCAHA